MRQVRRGMKIDPTPQRIARRTTKAIHPVKSTAVKAITAKKMKIVNTPLIALNLSRYPCTPVSCDAGAGSCSPQKMQY